MGTKFNPLVLHGNHAAGDTSDHVRDMRRTTIIDKAQEALVG
jgi:hypothetical protein